MEHSDVWAAIDDQRRALVHLLEDLSEKEWRQPSLCHGWTVRQVAAHLALQNTAWPAMPRAVLDLLRHGGMNGAIHAMGCRHAELPVQAIISEIRDRIGGMAAAAGRHFPRDGHRLPGARPGHRRPARPDPADATRPRRHRRGPDVVQPPDVPRPGKAGRLPAGGRRRPVGRRAGPGDLRAGRRAAPASDRPASRAARSYRAPEPRACASSSRPHLRRDPCDRRHQRLPRHAGRSWARPTWRTKSSPPSPPPASASRMRPS